MSRLEQIRDRIGDPLRAVNQKASKNIIEQQERALGPKNRKAQKSEQRRAQDEKFVLDWIGQQSESKLDPKQRFDLALERGNKRDLAVLWKYLGGIEIIGYRVNIHTSPEPSLTVDAKIA